MCIVSLFFSQLNNEREDLTVSFVLSFHCGHPTLRKCLENDCSAVQRKTESAEDGKRKEDLKAYQIPFNLESNSLP